MFKLMESSVDNWRHELPSIWSHGFSFSSFAVEEDSSLGGSQLACYDGEEPVINIVDPDQIFNLQQMDPPPSSDHTNHNGSGSSYGAANHHHLLIDGLNDALLFMEEDHHAAAGAGGGGVSSKFDQVGVGGSIDHCFNNNEEDRGVISVTTSSSMIIDQVSYSNKILTGSGGSNIICSSPLPLSVFTSSAESVVTDHHMDNNLIKQVVLPPLDPTTTTTTTTSSTISMTKKRKRILDNQQDHHSRKLGVVVGDLFSPQLRFNYQQPSQSECTSSADHEHQNQHNRGGTFKLICSTDHSNNRSSSSLINPRLSPHPPPPSRAVKGRPSKKKTKQLENSTTYNHPINISSSSTSNISFQRDPINNIKSTDGETIFSWTDNNHNNHDSSEPDAEAIQQMKEMIYRAAVFRPVNLGEDELGGEVLLNAEKRRRKNVRISTDPQTVAARQRRERISDRLRVLQKLVPGGSKMDTASMLDEAANYLKFLRSQIKTLESMGSTTGDDISNTTSWCNYPMMGSVIPGHVKYLQFSPSVLTMPMPSLVYSGGGGGGFSNPMQNQQHKHNTSSCGPVY